jgi:parallel beta-helix repeat protein
VANNSIGSGTYGVFIAPSEGNLVENNSVVSMAQGSSPVGIYLGVGAVRNATLSGNVITDCGVGIRAAANNVEQRVSGLSVIGNRVSGSLKQGIYLVQVNDSQVSGNIFEWNALEAIYLVSGSGNDIYDNAFLFNKASGRTYYALRAQAYCGEVQNDWYLGTGNLWADWLSPDANEDGVVDLPYLLPSGCQDPFPLTSIPGLDIADDIIPPEVIWYALQGTSADQSGAINMTFSEDMNTASVNVLVNDILQPGVWEDRIFTLNLTLEYDTEYLVKVTGKDLAGNNMSEFEWTFLTEVQNATVSGRTITSDLTPLPGVTVTCEGQNLLINETGLFSLTLVPGNHTLTFSKDGFLSKNVTVQIQPGLNVDIGDVVMEEIDDEEASSIDAPLIILVIVVTTALALGLWLWRRRK